MLSIVDHIYCLSAENSKRRPIVQQRLIDAQMTPFTFYPAIMDKSNPTKGCYLSHNAIWRHALDNGYSRILIFEDDVIFNRQLTTEDYQDIKYIIDTKQWMVFFLGHLPLTMKETSNKRVFLVHSLCTHAYIINCSYIPYLLSFNYKKLTPILQGIDGLLMYQSNCYALYPMICIQDNTMISQIDNIYKLCTLSIHQWLCINMPMSAIFCHQIMFSTYIYYSGYPHLANLILVLYFLLLLLILILVILLIILVICRFIF